MLPFIISKLEPGTWRGIRDTIDAEHPDVDRQELELQRGMARARLLHDEPAGILAAIQHDDKQRAYARNTTVFELADG